MGLPQPRSRCLSAPAVLVSVLTLMVTILPAPVLAATNQLTCSPTSLAYGSVAVGQSETLLVAVTNSGQTSVTISSVTVNNSQLEVSKLKLPQALAAGASLEVSVTFTPSKTGSLGGQVSVVSNASNPTLNVGVEGSGVTSETVTASPASVSFGNVAVGASSTVSVVLTNTRTSDVTLSSLQTKGSAFSVSGPKFPVTLASGKTVKLSATFKPQATGLTGGSVFVSGPALDIPLSGTGTGSSKPQLTITPATLSFGNVAVGATETLTAGLNASGGSVTISSVSSSNSQFAVPGVALPLTIQVGKEVLLNVTFTPKNSGNASATLSFSSNASNSSSESLSGTGTAPYVSLSWIASSSEVKGYNVYRSTSKTGSYTKLNSKVDADTSYTDATVVSGSTYYYATTAVNWSGQESSYSNQVKVVVP
jgi:hypothetical protein